MNQVAQPLMAFASGTAQAQLLPSAVSTLSAPFSPADIRTAYGFNQIQLLNPRNGKTVPGTGQGQTIAIVDAFNDPNITSDLSLFDQFFGLPAANFIRVDQNGNRITSANPGPANGPFNTWGIETALDVEWAHALAPNANIVLFEANSDSFSDLLTADISAGLRSVYNKLGVAVAGVISNSWGAFEFQGENAFDNIFATPDNHATYVFASGDFGVTSYPSASPNVLSAGGTSLTININTATGVKSYGGETAWSLQRDPGSPTGFDGLGGGTSAYEPEPLYQLGVQTSLARTTPDISFDADPRTGVIVLDNYLPTPLFAAAPRGASYAFQVGGTSVSAPSLSALLAVVNQSRALHGLSTLGNAQEAVYSLPSSDFHDITSGGNLNGSAAPGFDKVTGLGSPIAPQVVRDLTFASTVAPLTVSSTKTKPARTVARASDVSSNVGLLQVARVIGLPTPIGTASLGNSSLLVQSLPAVQVTPLISAQFSTAPLQTAVVTEEADAGGSDGVMPADNSDLLPAQNGEPATPGTMPTVPDDGENDVPPPAPASNPPSDRAFVDVVTLPAGVNSAPAEQMIEDDAKAIDMATIVAAAIVPGALWSVPAPEKRKGVPVLPKLR
jgi:hypothetical protein